MLFLLSAIAGLVFTAEAIIGTASLVMIVLLIYNAIWFRRKRSRLNQSWDYYKRTGDPSKLDPQSRAMLELAKTNEPEFLKAVEETRAAAEAQLARLQK